MSTDPETISVYNARSKDYAAMGHAKEERAELRAFIDQLPERARVLDLGCGPGKEAAQMIKAGAVVDAVDASAEMVKRAREIGVPARIATFQDVTETDVYDAIWASFSLLHAPKAEFPDILSRLHRALSEDGSFYIGMKLGEGEIRDKIGRLYSYYSEETLTSLLESAGFEVVSKRLGEGAGLSGETSATLTAFCRKVQDG